MIDMLYDMLAKIAREYTYERVKPFAKSEFAKFVTHDLALEAKKNLVMWPFDLKVKASVGAGQWAAVPWLAFFDPLITKSATKGFYVVILINAQEQSFTLSLNQGATAVVEEFGSANGRQVLKRRAMDIQQRVPEFAKQFDTTPIDLSSPASLPIDYEHGHAFGKTYQLEGSEKSDFTEDLYRILQAYQSLVDRGGTIPTDMMQDQSGTSGIEETRRYVLSRRIERAPSVRNDVLKKKEPVCEACGLDPFIFYDFQGKAQDYPLDVHHSKPLRGLAEGETRRYRIPEDFMILCPTCHRMIHKQSDPSDLEELKRRISKNAP